MRARSLILALIMQSVVTVSFAQDAKRAVDINEPTHPTSGAGTMIGLPDIKSAKRIDRA